MNKGIFKKYKFMVRYDSYHIGVIEVRVYLLPVLVPLCSTMFPMFPMVDINIRLALLSSWNQITQLVVPTFLLLALRACGCIIV